MDYLCISAESGGRRWMVVSLSINPDDIFKSLYLQRQGGSALG